MKTQCVVQLIAINFLCASAAVHAAALTPKHHFELSAGVEQDSNLNIVELDQSSQESDVAALLGAKVTGKWPVGEKFSVTGDYSYAQKTYQDYSAYDLAIHQFMVDAAFETLWLTLGASVNYADANLAKSDFLTLQQTSVYASKLINERYFLRSAVNVQQKDFTDRPLRSADNVAWVNDAFLFLNQGKSFVAIGLGHEQEDAPMPELNYTANTLRLKASHQFEGWGTSQKLQAGWRYFNRDYTGVEPEIKRKRQDNASIADIEWTLNLTDSIDAVSKIEYGKFNSNFTAADYAETRTSVTIKVRF